MVLDLRFRGREPGHAPPDVDAFRKPIASRSEEVAVRRGLRTLAPDEPLVLFFQHRGYGIPRFDRDRDRLPDLSSWRLCPTAFGYVATVPPRRRGVAAWIVAACLPLAIPSVAEAGSAAPDVQRPKKKSAKSEPEPEPEPEPEAEADAEAESDAEAELAEGEGEGEGEGADDLDAAEPPLDEPRPPPPPPPSAKRASVLDPATVDAAWEGVDGFEVELELKGGVAMRGRVGAVQRDTFTLIQSETGQVLVLPKSGVLSLRVYTPPPVPSQRGGGLIAGGIVLTTIATPVFITGMVFLGLTPSSVALHLPMILIGGGALAGGIPMIVAGARRRQAYLDALQDREVMPVASVTRHGWTGGLRFRF